MKKILLILALVGFTATGGYAQNKSCTCQKKGAYHKVASTHHKAAKKLVSNAVWTPAITVTSKNIASCYEYQKDNIYVLECPGVFYNKNDKGVFEYSEDGTYLGYYPVRKNTDANNCDTGAENTNEQMAPQHTTIDNYRGVAPAGGNFCNGKCTPQ